MNRNILYTISVCIIALVFSSCEKETDDGFGLFAKSVAGEYELADISWSGLNLDLDGDGIASECLLNGEINNIVNFSLSIMKADVTVEQNNRLIYRMVVPNILVTDACGKDELRYTLEYIEVSYLFEWQGGKLKLLHSSPEHWVSDEREEDYMEDISSSGFKFSFRTSIYEINSGETKDGRLIYSFARKQ